MLPSLDASVAAVAARARDAIAVLDADARTGARADALYLGVALLCFACGALCIASVALGVPIGVALAVARCLRGRPSAPPPATEARAAAPEWIDSEVLEDPPRAARLETTKI